MSLDLERLNDFSKEVYYKIIKRHPEWEQYATVGKYPWEHPKGYLCIKIPSPIPDIFPIEIAAIEDVPEEITIWFGPAHRHLCFCAPKSRRSLDGQLLTVEEIFQQIFNEELIGIQKKPGIFFVTEGLVEKNDYKKLLDKGKLRRAVSWEGTYNYPKDGTHLKWNP